MRETSENILGAFTPLILCTLSCVALYNLCIISKACKDDLLKDDTASILVKRLSTHDNHLMGYTLKLIYCLLQVSLNIDKFVGFGIVEELYVLL